MEKLIIRNTFPINIEQIGVDNRTILNVSSSQEGNGVGRCDFMGLTLVVGDASKKVG
jgi:hypothetical protein